MTVPSTEKRFSLEKTLQKAFLLGLACGIAQPLDLIRTQIVMYGDKKTNSIRQISAAMKRIYQKDGPFGFWKGSSM